MQNWANRLPRLTGELKFRFDAVQQFFQQMHDMGQQTEKITQNGCDPPKNTHVRRDVGPGPVMGGAQTDRNRAASTVVEHLELWKQNGRVLRISYDQLD
jgi:hypothetical protein